MWGTNWESWVLLFSFGISSMDFCMPIHARQVERPSAGPSATGKACPAAESLSDKVILPVGRLLQPD